MNQDNNIFSDSEDEDGQIEIEVVPEIDEESKEEEEWGGTESNSIRISEPILIASIMGLHPIQIQPISLIGRRRRREEETFEIQNKTQKNEIGESVKLDKLPIYSYIKVASGEEFYFTEEDSKKVLLNEVAEPNRLIRNIISKIPIPISKRLEYLAEFNAEDSNEIKRYEGDLKEAVLGAYIKEWRLRFLFKRLLIMWRIKKMSKVCEKEVDPITLTEPEKEIYVYDWSVKRKFVFDAKSLATLIETKLLYSEYGFPVPMNPKNPRNNVEFSYKQLLSIYNQLNKCGELRWAFTTFREYDFNRVRWQKYHRSALTMNAIKCSIQLLDSLEGRDLLSDFIFAKMDELGFKYDNYDFNSYQVAMARAPTHWYLERLKSLALLFYESEHFGYINKRVNLGCINIFKKHADFIRDLKDKKII
jgi:hypothetical protein